MKNILKYIVVVLVLVSCGSDKDISNQITKATFDLVLNSGEIEIVEYLDVTLEIKNLNSNDVTTKKVSQSSVVIDLQQGVYAVSVKGEIKYTLDGETKKGAVGGFVSGLNLFSENTKSTINLSLKSFSKDLIFEELFFTGTLTVEGKQYLGDKYFKLYNNTDEVIYADGLLLTQSKFQTVDKQDYIPNVMSTAITADAIIQIPGNGKDHPVKPGESITIAIDGINHLENCSNSFDLSTADFEMYFPKLEDIDNPEVENVITVRSQIVVNNRGFNSYVLARLPKGLSVDAFLSQNKYDYKFIFVYGSFRFPMEESDIKINNEWIVDAVALSVETEFMWNIFDPSLDSGWAYCGKIDADPDRYSKCVRRKVLQVVGGKRLLKDTNNSTVDFDMEVKPSLQL